MMDEYDVLDHIYEALPAEGFSASLYGMHGDMDRPEMYITTPDGDCWRIKAERHGRHD